MNTSVASHTVQASVVETTRTPGRYARAGLVAGLGAAVVNLAVVAIAHGLDVTFEVRGESIPVVAFPQMTLLAAIVGVGLAAALVRWARRARSVFLTVTIGLTALSLLPPLLVDTDTATRLVLELTHLVAAFIVIPAIASRIAD
jgi:Family of unknown function (DUF6069)